jgi:hypothetical protein
MSHKDTIISILVRYDFKRINDTEHWWMAREDPVMASIYYNDFTKLYYVKVMRIYGPSTRMPLFVTDELHTEWALNRCLKDLHQIKTESTTSS